jgi:acyl-CoA synthetase (AMP-forming)/AMP-acid ligase II
VALISVRDGATAPEVSALADHCRRVLAGYKVPRNVVVVDDVRRTVTGKGDYAWARNLAEHTTPEPSEVADDDRAG